MIGREFGKWMHDQLLTGTEAVPQSTKEDVIRLTQGIDSNLEKARIVYQYIQDRTRYISIQIGIGGWKPMSAMEVDQLGYGDCKGLTNYTKSLMEIAGVDAYYTVVYGGKEIIDLDSEFSSLQGNHVILTLPTDGEPYFWNVPAKLHHLDLWLDLLMTGMH
jgi:transglutaminase-like putative cysteine protease